MKKFTLMLAILLTLSPLARAASTWTQEEGYWAKVRGKFLYGTANIHGGWISLFHEPHQYATEGKNVFVGMGRGVYKAFAITLGGFAHFLTAPLTFIDIPLPDNGVDM